MNSDIVILDGAVATDDRGCVRFVNDFDFSRVKRFYQVENHKRGFIRAWHGHKKEAKYVYVPKGTAVIGVVKLPLSSTSESHNPEKFILSANKPQILYIPKGFANGAMTLEENTIIQYFSTSSLEESIGDDIRFAHNKWDIWKSEYR
tara:strand:+ start:114 stop:554 length:441 start_codon:yes stop_codon:yes gene_type:complete